MHVVCVDVCVLPWTLSLFTFCCALVVSFTLSPFAVIPSKTSCLFNTPVRETGYRLLLHLVHNRRSGCEGWVKRVYRFLLQERKRIAPFSHRTQNTQTERTRETHSRTLNLAPLQLDTVTSTIYPAPYTIYPTSGTSDVHPSSHGHLKKGLTQAHHCCCMYLLHLIDMSHLARS